MQVFYDFDEFMTEILGDDYIDGRYKFFEEKGGDLVQGRRAWNQWRQEQQRQWDGLPEEDRINYFERA